MCMVVLLLPLPLPCSMWLEAAKAQELQHSIAGYGGSEDGGRSDKRWVQSRPRVSAPVAVECHCMLALVVCIEKGGEEAVPWCEA